MRVEAVIGIISAGATIIFAVAGGTVWVCAKLERLHVLVTSLVSHEQCSERRRNCRNHHFRHRKKEKE